MGAHVPVRYDLRPRLGYHLVRCVLSLHIDNFTGLLAQTNQREPHDHEASQKALKLKS